MGLAEEVKKECGSSYLFESFMDSDEVYGYVNGQKQIWSDKAVASVTAGCLRIDAAFRAGDDEHIPVFGVCVKEAPAAKEWFFYGYPSDPVPEIDDAFESLMIEALERYREANGLSYMEPDFETLSGKILKYTEKPFKGDEMSMV